MPKEPSTTHWFIVRWIATTHNSSRMSPMTFLLPLKYFDLFLTEWNLTTFRIVQEPYTSHFQSSLSSFDCFSSFEFFISDIHLTADSLRCKGGLLFRQITFCFCFTLFLNTLSEFQVLNMYRYSLKFQNIERKLFIFLLVDDFINSFLCVRFAHYSRFSIWIYVDDTLCKKCRSQCLLFLHHILSFLSLVAIRFSRSQSRSPSGIWIISIFWTRNFINFFLFSIVFAEQRFVLGDPLDDRWCGRSIRPWKHGELLHFSWRFLAEFIAFH